MKDLATQFERKTSIISGDEAQGSQPTSDNRQQGVFRSSRPVVVPRTERGQSNVGRGQSNIGRGQSNVGRGQSNIGRGQSNIGRSLGSMFGPQRSQQNRQGQSTFYEKPRPR